MWSNGVGAVCILVTRVVSFTLVNVYELKDRKAGIKIMQTLSCISQHRVKACKPWLSSTFCWRQTFKANKQNKAKTNKNRYKKTKTKKKTTTKKHTNQNKTKRKYTKSERSIHYTRSMEYRNKFFLDSKIQHLIQWDKFTPLSATKEQLSYQHWKSEKNLIYVHFKCRLRLIPFSQYSPSNPGGHKHRYPLSVNPDWQVALFSQWGLLSQAF